MPPKKYSPRSMPAITRESYNVEKTPSNVPHWIDEFAKNLEKISVQPVRYEKSVYDQISSIMGIKSKFSTVDAAVEDMKHRSGLTDYLKKAQRGAKTTKKANVAEIALFKKLPQIKSTVDNYIEDSRGNLPIPSIVEKLKSIHKMEVADEADWDQPSLLQYINNKNVETKQKYPNLDSNYSNLGRITLNMENEKFDPSNTDAFHALTPAITTAAQDEARILSYLYKK